MLRTCLPLRRSPALTRALRPQLRLSVMRLRRRLANERDPGNALSMSAMAVLGCLHRHGDLTIGELAAARAGPAAEHDQDRQLPSRRAGTSPRRLGADGRQVVVSLTELGLDTLMADRRRRDEWLAKRLRELSADERAVLRQAAPILERLAGTP